VSILGTAANRVAIVIESRCQIGESSTGPMRTRARAG
jgi:hypothetical protein